MRCSTVKSTDVENECLGTATHLLIGSIREDEGSRTSFRDPVCEPCGRVYARRPAFKARVVPLHIYTPASAFTEVIEGHRLINHPEHGRQCYDCGRTDSIPVFQMTMLHGCKGRPESVDHLALSREAAMLDASKRAEKSAGLWFQEAAHDLGMAVEDWRPVTGHPSTCATFTFRDREYRVIYDLDGYRICAEKLPNRGYPDPDITNADLDYRQAVFSFHGRTTESGSEYFATWTPGHADVTDRELIILYTPEGAISEVLRVPGPRLWEETTGAICDAFGPISRVNLQTRIYQG